MNLIHFLLSLSCAFFFTSPTFAAPAGRYDLSQSRSSPYLTTFIEPDVGGKVRYLKGISTSFWKEPEEDIFHVRALEDTVFVSVRPTHSGIHQFVVGNEILSIAEEPR
ncbi:hypothetical protein IW261DRAFT_1565794 [Armillaria novae-zelandiae]|uniref:Uncharacterized protein n=1 Tax=Armillaria novae-zelandiae TaxID=153914 RepID=A0AA39UGJ8_9AGAR|nr:hypothetical protein IW261DRAFT_1565794 [Armillaria novae-zelandiae]